MDQNSTLYGNKGYVAAQLWHHHYPLNFGTSIPVSGMVALHTIGDGSCLIHSIVQAFYRPYILGQIDRRQFVRDLRKALSDKLDQPVDGEMIDASGKKLIWYQLINRGGLSKLHADPGLVPKDLVQRMQLVNMKNELNSTAPLDNLYDDYISKMLNKNIFVIDLHTMSVKYNIDKDILLSPNRPCVVILDKSGHYETIGIKEQGVISTYFSWNHPFIIQLRILME